MSSWTDEDKAGGTHPSSPSHGIHRKEEMFSEAGAGYGPTLAPLPRVKSYSESYPIPSTVILSSTSPNDSYSNRGPNSSILLASSTHCSPHWHQLCWQHKQLPHQCRPTWLACPYTHSPTCRKSSGTCHSPGVDGRGTT